ncbi:MAG: hypothetical protein JW727_02190 [Candidatus Aenigmarchaeota archaeon]|nr:hypothetical protein [Candidatus Aenigmarchaeota archaeon]
MHHRTEDGLPRKIEVSAETGQKDVMEGRIGCSDFEPCGMPALPSTIDRMCLRNQKATLIPSDPTLETNLDFINRRLRYPYKEFYGGKLVINDIIP